MTTKASKKTNLPVAQNPLILRCQRLMEAFAKSDDERDFYIDRVEGFLVYVDLDRPTEDLDILYQELDANNERYCLIPKLTFFETKKIMEGFVNEKVYDIDTKEKLLDIIQSKEAREHFLEFIYDHHSELEKWQQYYQERSRIRIIEWLRKNEFHFVFEEDLDFNKNTLEGLKKGLFSKDVSRDVLAARKVLATKAKTYYSNEALNPRPKRGRPPKQIAKLDIEPQISIDIYTQVPGHVRPFLFTPDLSSSSAATFSSKFESESELVASKRTQIDVDHDVTLESLNKKLAMLRQLSTKFADGGISESVNGYDGAKKRAAEPAAFQEDEDSVTDENDFEEDAIMVEESVVKLASGAAKKPTAKKPAVKKAVAQKPAAKKSAATKPAAKKAVAKKPAAVKKPVAKKATVVKKTVAKKAPAKKATTVKKAPAKKVAVKKVAVKKTAAKKAVSRPKAATRKTAKPARKSAARAR